MTEKRYYQRDFEELYYVIDSNVISEKEFDERVEYDGYSAFEDSLTGEEIVDLLNKQHDENEQLLKEKIDAETKLYKANEQLLMQMDYDNLCKENQDMEFELIKIKKENEQLKQALKNSYINEICENCKYGDYFLSDNFDGGFEGNFECLKKHFGNDHWECDGLKECDDFELDIKLKR